MLVFYNLLPDDGPSWAETYRRALFFDHGATAPPQLDKATSLSGIHVHTQLYTLHSVVLLWTSDQSDAQTST